MFGCNHSSMPYLSLIIYVNKTGPKTKKMHICKKNLAVKGAGQPPIRSIGIRGSLTNYGLRIIKGLNDISSVLMLFLISTIRDINN